MEDLNLGVNLSETSTAQRGYWQDPLRFEFEAEVMNRVSLPDGRRAVTLSETYFYPTGGGQEHDTGRLGEARVLEALTDEAGNVLHVVDREVGEEVVQGRVDRERRLHFMQQHSGQHLLSAAFVRALGAETVSARLSLVSPCTIDLGSGPVPEAELRTVEDLANAVIREDRSIRSYFVTQVEVAKVPFRRAPVMEGVMRVVEIESFDHSACGGTHLSRTGMIGLVKLLRAEKRGEKVRVYFWAGERALRQFQEEHATVSKAASLLNSKPEEIVEALTRQIGQYRAAQEQLTAWAEERLDAEAARLAAGAEISGTRRIVTARLQDRPVGELRGLASRLQEMEGVVAILTLHDGSKLSCIVTCASGTGLNAGALMREGLAELGARGGGDARMAQGGGAATAVQVESLVERLRGRAQEAGGPRK